MEATGAHSNLRVQFYPTPGSPTVEIDDVDVHRSLAVNGGFEYGSGPWTPYPNTGSNYVVYTSSTARSGSHYAATNTAKAGGGIYEDVPLTTAAGQLICGSAWVRTEGSATGASGSFALWLTGEAPHEAGVVRYGGLGNGWTQVQTCVEATGAHSNLRVQFYPTPGSPTVEIDDVDVHQSLAANGGFEYGSGPWGTYPNTNSSYDVLRTSEVAAPPPAAVAPVVTTPVATPIPTPKARRALKVKLYLSWTWRYGTTWLNKIRIGRFPAKTRLQIRCLGRSCPIHHKMSATGARRVHHLLRAMKGRRFGAGDVLRITLTAPGYKAERAEVKIRYARLPLARLLRS